MLKWLSKNKWLALGLVVVLLFTLLPTHLNWADEAIFEPNTEEMNTAFMTETEETETVSTEEVVTTEAVTEDSQTDVTTESDAGTQADTTENGTTEVSSEKTTAAVVSSTDKNGVGDSQAVTEAPATTEATTTEQAVNTFATKDEIQTYAASGNLVDDSNFQLRNVTLRATYVDENNVKHTVELSAIDDNMPIPSDATLFLRFDFLFFDGNEIEVGKEYIYKLPPEIRVDVDETHELLDQEGKSIGTVHISPDGTLTFVFNDNVEGQENIPFYVQFEGGFSESAKSEGDHVDVDFPAQGGSFDFDIELTEPSKKDEDKEIPELAVQKSGSKKHVTVGNKDVTVIEWQVTLILNGREDLTADITDLLPDGLTYADVVGYPKLSNQLSGDVSCTTADGEKEVHLHVENVNGYYSVTITFCTYYDETIFGDKKITNNNGVSINNTVAVEEEGSDTGVTGAGSAYVTQDVLSKSGTKNGDGTITWTVVINRDQLDISGTTYTDKFGDGYSWDGKYTIDPAGAGTLTPDADRKGFTFTVNPSHAKDTITIQYTTTIDDYTQSEYINEGKLTDPSEHFDASAKGRVGGDNLLEKINTGFDPVTKQLKWQITVNADKYDFGENEVTLEDIFSFSDSQHQQNKMKLLDIKVVGGDTDGLDYEIDKKTGTIKFKNLGKRTVIIEVSTQILDAKGDNQNQKWKDGDWATAYNRAKLTWPDGSVTDDASKGFQYKTPEVIKKKGTINKDGTIDWVIYFTHHAGTTEESIVITDTIPEGLEFVEGSVVLMENEWSHWNHPDLQLSGVTSGRTLTITIDQNSSDDLKYYLNLNNGFEIHYKTRATNLENADKSISYTNNAEAEVEYEGGATVEDTASDTVTGEVGGKLGKEAFYQYGNDYVDWTVTINEAGYALNVKEPVIRDHLAEYFDYVQDSAELWLVENGVRVRQVTEGFSVTVVNNEMIVKLPDIENETYELTFRTKFNVWTPDELAGVTIKNSIELTGKDYRDSVTSDEVKNVHFASSSAGSRTDKELRIFKVGEDGLPLAGATFDLYYDGVYVTTVTTGDDGYAIFKGIGSSASGYTYVIKEAAAPDGYKKLDKDITVVITDESFTADANGVRYYEEKVTNKLISTTTQFSIQKTDADNSKKKLKGARFTVYRDKACTDEIAAKVSDDNGMISFSVEYSGDETHYYVKETTVPDGYLDNAKAKYIYHFVADEDGKVTFVEILDKDGNLVESKNQELTGAVTITNEKTKAILVINKVIENTKTPIQGAVFTLYADKQCTDEVATGTTNAAGIIEFKNLVPGRTYYYRETYVPEGYILDDTVHSITMGSGTEHEEVKKEVTVENEEARGSIKITKTDDTANANKLKGVTFKLYKANGDPYPDPPAKQFEATTNEDGVATFDNLPFGTYVVKEDGAPNGYVVDTKGTTIVVNSEKATEVTIVNKLIRFNIKVVKQDDSGNPLEGVLFQVRDKSGKLVASGRTDKDGNVEFKDIPYGDYTITEAEGLPGYNKDATKWTITSNDITKDGITLTKTFVNTKQNASIKFKKRSAEANRTDPGAYLEGAEFSVYDSNGELVTTVTSGADGVVEITGLIYGTYTIKETKAPFNYMLSEHEWVVNIDHNGEYKLEVDVYDNDGTALVDNTEIPISIKYMSFKLNKLDQGNKALPGALFILYKTYTKAKFPDDWSNPTTAPEDWVIIGRAYSAADGSVAFYNIDIKEDADRQEDVRYRVQEVTPPNGYAIKEKYGKEYSYSELPGKDLDGDDVPDIGHEDRKANSNELNDVPTIDTYINEQILGSITVIKSGSNAVNALLKDAEFTLYHFDVTKNEYVKYGDTLKTDENGTLQFKDLPYGTYRVKETKAPKGYVLSANAEKVFKIPDEDGVTVDYTYKVSDSAIKVSVNKFAVGGSTQLSGAVLELYAEGDEAMKNCLFRWTTTNIAQQLSSSLFETGKTYFIHEAKAPDGYKKSADVYFTINSDGSLTYKSGANGSVDNTNKAVIIRDESIELWIYKEGQSQSGSKAGLAGAKISLIDEMTGETVYTFTSNGNATKIPSEVLMLPEAGKDYRYYIVREESAPGGYALAMDMIIGITSEGRAYQIFRNDDGSIQSVTSWGNNTVTMTDKEYADFYFAKRDAVTEEYLAGAKFLLERVTDTTIDAREQVAEWKSTAAQKLYNIKLDPGRYVFTEIEAPNGYTLEEPITFDVVEGDPKDYIELVDGHDYNLSSNALILSSRDNTINVTFAKWGDNHKPLEGGKFVLYESDATWVLKTKLAEFPAETDPITLANTYFKLGGYYVIVEEEAPANYQPSGVPLRFSIDQDGKAHDEDGNFITNNRVTFINGEKQLSFQKIDAVTGIPMSDVELTLSSDEDKTFTTQSWFTDGETKYFGYSEFKQNATYILSEATTVNGYGYAASISFMIDSDDNVYIDGELSNTGNIVMKNQPFTVSIDKYELGTTQYISDAKLQITDSEGTIVDAWTTKGESHSVDPSKLKASKTDKEYVYTLTETEAPELYAKAQPIEFWIDSKGAVHIVDGDVVENNRIVMYDEYRGIAFSKQDVGGKEVKGATLTITSDEDEDFGTLTWESTDTPKNWSRDLFKPNKKYILTETAAPDGYAYAESIEFWIDEDGVVYVNGKAVDDQTVTMVDAVLKMSIAKRDATTNELLSGATLSILQEATATTVYTWDTQGTVNEIPNGVLKASKDGESRTVYVLKETAAPKGYELAGDIRFYIDQQGNVYTIDAAGNATLAQGNVISMYDAKSDVDEAKDEEEDKDEDEDEDEDVDEDEDETGTKTASKKTGDSAPIAMAGVLLFLSLTGAGVTIAVRRRKRK